jgi:hypothetical protein
LLVFRLTVQTWTVTNSFWNWMQAEFL